MTLKPNNLIKTYTFIWPYDMLAKEQNSFTKEGKIM